MPLRLFWGHVSHRGIPPAPVCKVSWATAWTFTFSHVEWGLGQRQFWIYDSSRSMAQCQAQCQCSRNSCHAFPQLSGQAYTWMEEPQCCWEGKHWGEAGTWESQEIIHSTYTQYIQWASCVAFLWRSVANHDYIVCATGQYWYFQIYFITSICWC